MLSIPDNTQSGNAFNSTRRRYEQATLVAGDLQAAEFTLHSVTSGRRKQLESYVAEQYNRSYGARITHFMPLLLSMSRAGQLEVVVGVRSAYDDALFLEHYLDKPVEQEMKTPWALARCSPAFKLLAGDASCCGSSGSSPDWMRAHRIPPGN